MIFIVCLSAAVLGSWKLMFAVNPGKDLNKEKRYAHGK